MIIKFFKKVTVLLFLIMVFSLGVIGGSNTSKDFMDGNHEKHLTSFKDMNKDCQRLVVAYLSADAVMQDGHPNCLMTVCKNWRMIIKHHKPLIQKFVISRYDLSEDEKIIYDTFFTGEITYTHNNNEPVMYYIKDLWNPLEGSFDLSMCGFAGRCLTISTGYRTKILEDDDRSWVETWIPLQLLIKRRLSTTASHFEEMFKNWNQDIGLVWNCSREEKLKCVNYVVSKNFEEISSKTLFENWELCDHQSATMSEDVGIFLNRFHLRFKKKN